MIKAGSSKAIWNCTVTLWIARKNVARKKQKLVYQLPHPLPTQIKPQLDRNCLDSKIKRLQEVKKQTKYLTLLLSKAN